jgi:hypothetical protein
MQCACVENERKEVVRFCGAHMAAFRKELEAAEERAYKAYLAKKGKKK